jgi:hypothetical protein
MSRTQSADQMKGTRLLFRRAISAVSSTAPAEAVTTDSAQPGANRWLRQHPAFHMHRIRRSAGLSYGAAS